VNALERLLRERAAAHPVVRDGAMTVDELVRRVLEFKERWPGAKRSTRTSRTYERGRLGAARARVRV